VRSFTYNSLSRLLISHNPESGKISYSYDADGNMLQKTSPAPKPDRRHHSEHQLLLSCAQPGKAKRIYLPNTLAGNT